MKGDWTWGDFFQAFLGVVQWTIAVVSVAGALALFGWILALIVKKDKAR